MVIRPVLLNLKASPPKHFVKTEHVSPPPLQGEG